MNIRKGMLSIGWLMLIAGLIVALISNHQSEIIRYIIAGNALLSGVFAIRVSRHIESYKQSIKYIWLEGGAMIMYALVVAFFAGNVSFFISATGLFLLVFAMTEFTIVLQILANVEMPEFRLILEKLAVMVISAVGAVHILTTATLSSSVAILLIGLITTIIGVGYITRGITAGVVQEA